MKIWTCYVYYNLLTGRLNLTPCTYPLKVKPLLRCQNGLIVGYCSHSVGFQGVLHIKIILKAILLIIYNTHTNSLPETTFSLSILCSMFIL